MTLDENAAGAERCDSPRPSVAAAIVGRDRELKLIAMFVEKAAADGGALLLSGEPGVGKTMLLNATADAASTVGMWVLRAAGAEFEADMPYSGLHQVLLHLFDEFAQLTAPHRDALTVALGFGAGPAPERLLVSNAALMILRRAATARPVLVVIDDLSRLDRVSAGVLGFVARRLAGSRIGFLAAYRSGEESCFKRAGLPQHDLGRLDDRAAADLVSARFPELAPRVRQRVLAEGQGNPLALLEWSVALGGSQPTELAGLPAVLPLNGRLQAMFASPVAELPSRTRRLLLLMALDGTGDLRVLRATGADPHGLDDLAAAERARLAYVDHRTHRLAFRHPLIRAAMVELATDSERCRAHEELAGLLADQPERQAWHLAEAAVEPDEHVASLLEQVAQRILARGDAAGAVATLIRASELSLHSASRSRWLAKAAYIGASVTGELDTASRLLADARRADPDLSGSPEAAIVVSYLLLNGDGDVETAHRLLVGTIANRVPGDDAKDSVLEEALHALLQVCRFGGKAELWRSFCNALARLAPSVPVALELASKVVADPVRTAAPALAQLDAAIVGLADEIDPVRIMRIANSCEFVDRYGLCRDALWRVVRDGREGGAVGLAITALILLGFDHFRTGHWEQSLQLTDEALKLSEPHGYQILGAHLNQAIIAACRGDDDRMRAVTNAMLHWGEPRGVRIARWYACYGQGLAALGRGDFEEAYQQASTISPLGSLASYVPYATWVMMDLIEAAMRTGRHAEASAHVAAILEADVAALSPRLALLAGGSAAIAAPNDTAAGLFEEALRIPGIDRWPFDLARVQLAYGERLRRARATALSRVHLTAALETFERLGARPWATRASNELRATGQTRACGHAHESLTPQEREIAMLAAGGLTNKQIGKRLFLSHRTVGAHLHRAFCKLGITTRASLRDALASFPQNSTARIAADNLCPVGESAQPRG